MKYLLTIFIAMLFFSCQFFDAEKISSETFYEEELKTIDWDDVDRYPSFDVCEVYTEKIDQKKCFESTLVSHLQRSLKSRSMIAYKDVEQTVQLAFIISEEGKIVQPEITMDSSLQKTFPKLKKWILKSVDSIPPFMPAYKRGIPVKTHFTLPMVIKTEGSTN